jgi:hypothetical protein
MFELIANVGSFIQIFGGWVICSFTLLIIIFLKRKQHLTKTNNRIFWFVVLTLAFVHWNFVKVDPLPLIANFKQYLDRERIEKKRLSDSLGLYSKPDSSIEYVKSIDTNETGVYIWLNNKRQLLRKLTKEEINGGQMRTDLDKEALKK